MKPTVPIAAKKLRLRYGLLHGLYWSAYCCIFGFSTAFLLHRGFGTAAVGLCLAAATLLSGLLQPAAAALADRRPERWLRRLPMGLALAVLALLGLLLCLPLPGGAYLVLYTACALLLDLVQPLLNALSVYYSERGTDLPYGPARGAGSIFYAAVSLLLGRLIQYPDAPVTLLAAGLFLVLFLLVCGRMPRPADTPPVQTGPRPLPCSLSRFFRRYPRFCASMPGILLMQTCLMMLETYLISILERVGGSQSDLGVTLAIATCVEIPILLFYPRFRSLAPVALWLKTAGVFTLFKALAFLLAPSARWIMAAQTLQLASYALYAVCAVDYARESTGPADAVKGQAMVTSACTLGTSLGNLLGGQLIARSGVRTLLLWAVGTGAAAAVIYLLTVRSGPARPEQPSAQKSR